MKKISPLVYKLIEEFTRENYCTSKEINSGLCEDFAMALIEEMGGYKNNLFELTSDMFYSDFPEDVNDWSGIIRTIDGAVWSKDMLSLYGYPDRDVIKLHIGHHVWVYYNGLHYDSEAPRGVKTPWNLPFFQRQINKAT